MYKIKKIINNHKEFEDNIENILQYANEITADLPYKGKISRREKFLLLESLILKVCALWEKFLENELILSVNLDSSKLIKEMDLRSKTKLDIRLIRAILFSDIFRDFHDLDRSKNFFSKYITNRYNPFKEISKNQVKNIKFIYKIRNYLSHYSEFSRCQLFKAYKKEYKLTHFIEPGQFLSRSKGKRFQELVSNFKYSSINMKKIFRRN